MKKFAIAVGLATVFPLAMAVIWLDDMGVFRAPPTKAPGGQR